MEVLGSKKSDEQAPEITHHDYEKRRGVREAIIMLIIDANQFTTDV
jgi:hypothetical protein